MYIPINPVKLEDSWQQFKKSIESQPLSYVIIDGEFISKSLPYYITSLEADNILLRLKNTGYVRFGFNKGTFVPCHFAVKMNRDHEGILNELITRDDSIEQVKSDIFFIVDFVFFELPLLKNLIIPFKIEITWVGSEFKIDYNEKKKETLITRI